MVISLPSPVAEPAARASPSRLERLPWRTRCTAVSRAVAVSRCGASSVVSQPAKNAGSEAQLPRTGRSPFRVSPSPRAWRLTYPIAPVYRRIELVLGRRHGHSRLLGRGGRGVAGYAADESTIAPALPEHRTRTKTPRVLKSE